jgi:S-adenosylmethionine:tRNA ribosyltransferase-isomerase
MSEQHPHNISISDFTYDLPVEKIAAFPNAQRDASKLLVYRKGQIQESVFKKLGEFLPAQSLLVFNDTRVVSARLGFKNGKGQAIEVFCLGPAPAGTDPSAAMATKTKVRWLCLVGNLKQWREKELVLEKEEIVLKATIVSKHSTDLELEFSWEPEELSFSEVIEALGEVPIPPYLKRASSELDKERYQTVYAHHDGSVAAPTAGLHFTGELLDGLKRSGVETLLITLHVGAGTFKPVKSETLSGHDMHAEWIDLDLETIEMIRSRLSHPVIPVGTTSLRALESLYWMGVKAFHHPHATIQELEIGQWEVYKLNESAPDAEQSLDAMLDWMRRNGLNKLACSTRILIAPPYELKLAKGIITNFHQPQSTLLLIIAAVAGAEWKTIYNYALEHDFRFLSYGDSSLLLK